MILRQDGRVSWFSIVRSSASNWKSTSKLDRMLEARARPSINYWLPVGNLVGKVIKAPLVYKSFNCPWNAESVARNVLFPKRVIPSFQSLKSRRILRIPLLDRDRDDILDSLKYPSLYAACDAKTSRFQNCRITVVVGRDLPAKIVAGNM